MDPSAKDTRASGQRKPELVHWLSRCFSILLYACVLMTPHITLAASLHRYFISPIGEANWRASGNPLRCGLSLDVPDYGKAYFEQYATKEPHFILHKYQQSPGYEPAKVKAVPPVWKPDGRSFFVAQTKVKPGKFGFYLSRVPTLKLLNYLAEGYKSTFRYHSHEGFLVTVALSPVNFQQAYETYIDCVGHLLPFDYDDISHLTIDFPSGGWALTYEDKVILDKVVKYTLVDRRVKQVRIEGYTDDTGRRSVNNAISEQRAHAVEKYLLEQNINPKLLSVTWFGEDNPIADNNDEAGQKKNRRVTVDVFIK